jgi:hypothetical protein
MLLLMPLYAIDDPATYLIKSMPYYTAHAPEKFEFELFSDATLDLLHISHHTNYVIVEFHFMLGTDKPDYETRFVPLIYWIVKDFLFPDVEIIDNSYLFNPTTIAQATK